MSSNQYKDIVVKIRGSRVEGKQPTYMCFETGKFSVCSDRSNGDAPSPVEYLLVALAGCINIVGAIVAKEMSIEINSMEIDVEGTFNPKKLYTGIGERAGYKNIVVRVKVNSNSPIEKLQEWIKKVEERCPVGDNLTQTTPIEIQVEKHGFSSTI